MELHELHVREPGAGAVRYRITVARSNLWIGRVSIDLSAPTCREHRCIGDNLDRLSRDGSPDTEHDPVFSD